MPTTPQLYRSLLRQFTLNSIHARPNRSRSILAHLRLIFERHRDSPPHSAEAARLERDVLTVVEYLKAQRLHKALLERYNSSDGMSGEERATKSAAMVGLDMPRAFDPDRAPTMEHGREPENQVKDDTQGGGTLQSFVPPGR